MFGSLLPAAPYTWRPGWRAFPTMIFYGTNGTHYATEPLAGAACPACHTPEALQLGLVSRYAHVYWIPLFPYQKLAVTQCRQCQMSWTEKELAPALASTVRAARQRHQAPYWHWAGLVLIAALGLYSYLHSIRDARTDEALLASPHAGDIYTIRSESE